MSTTTSLGLQEVALDQIIPWPGLNPRTTFDEDKLQELAESIRDDGLIQPVAAAPAGADRENGESLWLFAGERRLRASRLAGLTTIQVIVRDVDEKTAHRLAGLENIDRSNLTAIEEARWLQRELELTGLTQKELGAEIGGLSQGWVANRIRLLELPEPIQHLIEAGTIAPATARDALLRFAKLDEDLQGSLFGRIVKDLREGASEGSPLSTRAVQAALVGTLEDAGGVRVQEGFQHVGDSYTKSLSVTAKQVGAFKKAHSGRCVQAQGWRHADREVTWTFATAEWDAFREGLCKEQNAGSKGSGKTKRELEKVRLGPKKKTTTLGALKQKYGYDAVTTFDLIVDPTKLEPRQVVRVRLEGHETSSGKPRDALAVVAAPGSLRAMKAARTRRVTPRVASESQKLARNRLKKASRMGTDEVLRGALTAILSSDYFEHVCELIRAEGIDVPDSWSRYSVSGKKVNALDLEGDALFRVAAAATALVASDEHAYDTDNRVRKAAERAVGRETKKARDDWAKEHGFAEASS